MEKGAALFRQKQSYEIAQMLRDHGMSKEKHYWHETVGYNYRLTNLQAAIGCAQLEQLAEFRKRRIEVFGLYDSLLLPTGLFEKQVIKMTHGTSYWLYTVCLQSTSPIKRDSLMEKLRLVGIDSRPTFYPMHQMPAFSHLVSSGPFPVSTDIAHRGISLPSSVELSDDDIQSICNRLIRAGPNRLDSFTH